MVDANSLLLNYQITPADVNALREMAPLFEGSLDELTKNQYETLAINSELSRFFKNEKFVARSKMAFSHWLSDFLSGDFSESSFTKLKNLGHAYASMGLPESITNLTISNIRTYLTDLIWAKHQDNPLMASQAVMSLNKILDLNLDIMTRACHEEELKTHFISKKLDSSIIRLAKWFVTGFNIILVLGLLCLGILTLGMWSSDVGHLFSDTSQFERGVLGMLGSLLILWVVIELLDTQISHIRGRAFAIKVFVSVALVAELRKILIFSIEDTPWIHQATIAGSVLVLGFVYWLISRTE